MSVRPKSTVQSQFASQGSLFSSSVDLKPGVFLPNSKPIGIELADGDKPNGQFTITMYYGRIKDDPDVRLDVPGASSTDESYFRIRVNWVDGYESQKTVGTMIQGNLFLSQVTGALGNLEPLKLSDAEHFGKSVHVCGNPVASYLVQMFRVADKNYIPDFAAVARAISGGKSAGIPFKIQEDDDGCMYTYKLERVTNSSASMIITRVSTPA